VSFLLHYLPQLLLALLFCDQAGIVAWPGKAGERGSNGMVLEEQRGNAWRNGGDAKPVGARRMTGDHGVIYYQMTERPFGRYVA